MKDYKTKQMIYHKTQAKTDLLSNLTYREENMTSSDIVKYGIDYCLKEVETIFPAKSYIVTIIYGKLLERYFGCDFYEAISDKDLFLDTDKFFVPYPDDKTTYDELISNLQDKKLLDFKMSLSPQVVTTVDYFKKEFLWKEEDLTYCSDSMESC